MNYPFPPPRTTLLLEWTVVLTLMALAFVPLVRILARRKRPPNGWDTAIGLIALVLTLVVGNGFPFILDGVRHPYAKAVATLMALTITVLLTWSLATPMTRKPSLHHRLSELAVPYVAGLFMGAVVPAVSYAGEPSYRFSCRNNLKNILLGMHNYHDSSSTFPALVTQGSEPPRSWRVELLPFLDHTALRNQYVDAATWDALENAPVTNHQRDYKFSFLCRSSPRKTDDAGRYYSAYFGVRGPNTLFPDGRGLNLKTVTDGTSNTIAVVEACGTPIVWTEPRDIDLAEQDIGVNLPGEQPGLSRGVISSYHREGGHIGLADGSVRFVSEKIDPNVLRALLSATGGEPVGEF